MKETKLRALLIDPFQQRVHELLVDPTLEAWHKLLDCQTVERFAPTPEIDIWIDDEGKMRNPPYPYFVWQGYPDFIAGYGLVLAHEGPESVSTPLTSADLVSQISFEDWEKRLKPEDYFDQLSRIYLFHSGTFGQGKAQGGVCSICHRIFHGWGNNAQPVNYGRCCNQCNQEVVIPARQVRMSQGLSPY